MKTLSRKILGFLVNIVLMFVMGGMLMTASGSIVLAWGMCYRPSMFPDSNTLLGTLLIVAVCLSLTVLFAIRQMQRVDDIESRLEFALLEIKTLRNSPLPRSLLKRVTTMNDLPDAVLELFEQESAE